jgi:hypothetical protein
MKIKFIDSDTFIKTKTIDSQCMNDRHGIDFEFKHYIASNKIYIGN